ncbi:MAG: GxxExxY protein [Anaerolineae bacterium]|nr:GxxExxY protein [Anaerolineae bacterium]MDK1081049.1 GxxExxY protein [Anaerolineae bacterium]MDK1118056.1 GxxExxY protein [Anaerolineae bacterium]
MTREIEQVARDIVDAAFKVHKEFGPGLLESAYQQCHAFELRKRGRKVMTEVFLPIVYDGQKIDAGYRIDMLVDDLIIIENKAVETIHPIHMAQMITYLKLKDCRLGFLINWNVNLIKNGIKRIANGMVEPSRPFRKPNKF